MIVETSKSKIYRAGQQAETQACIDNVVLDQNL